MIPPTLRRPVLCCALRVCVRQLHIIDACIQYCATALGAAIGERGLPAEASKLLCEVQGVGLGNSPSPSTMQARVERLLDDLQVRYKKEMPIYPYVVDFAVPDERVGELYDFFIYLMDGTRPAHICYALPACVVVGCPGGGWLHALLCLVAALHAQVTPEETHTRGRRVEGRQTNTETDTGEEGRMQSCAGRCCH